jgi:predicted ester cyclase
MGEKQNQPFQLLFNASLKVDSPQDSQCRGTHRGPFFGVPPTGKPIEVQAMNFYTLSGGQFVEERGQPDLLGLLQQISAVPR